MDTLAHGLWGGAAFGRPTRKDYWLAFFLGVGPDLFSFGLFFLSWAVQGFPDRGWAPGEPPPLSLLPSFVSSAYNVTHSLLVWGVVFALLWLRFKKPPWIWCAWALHILCDIPTHTTRYFPTPFLWPLSTPFVNGFSWGTPWFMALNYVALGLAYWRITVDRWGDRRQKDGLTSRQRRRVRNAFKAFSGPDELIDAREWKAALGLRSDFLVDRIFHLVDADGSGFIDWEEFLAFAGYFYADDSRRRLRLVFRIYDLDGDGFVGREELRRLIEASLSEQSVTLSAHMVRALTLHLIKRVDRDKDGKISEPEFVDAMAGYPGIEEQFSVYAADWLNDGMGFRPPPVEAAAWRRRLTRLWRSRGVVALWTFAYLGVNAGLFIWAFRRYGALGADIPVQIARGAGACLNFNGAFILLPTCRALWTAVRRWRIGRFFPLDAMTDAHRVMGIALILFSAVHIGAHVSGFLKTGGDVPAFLTGTPIGVSGLVLTATLLVLWGTARLAKGGRRETFAAVHFLYAVWLAALLAHGSGFWLWLAAPGVIFLSDALVRWFLKTKQVPIAEMKALADGVTRVRFTRPRRFRFQPGDYLLLNIPVLSRGEWHPFTISAAPEAEEFGVHVRNNGNWTGALHNLSRKKKTGAEKKWTARIDGPYAAPTSRVRGSKVAVLIAGGIGVTPFASVLQSLLLRVKESRRREAESGQTIHFHWLNRSHRSYEWFVGLLHEAETVLKERFKLHIHLTSMTHDLTNIAMQVAMDAYYERHGRDPVTGLRAVTSAGRPDWDTAFKAVSEAHPGEAVDVYLCGPRGLASAVRKSCRKHGFLLHEEKF